MKKPLQVVLDTNVLIAALRSQRGASYKLLRAVGQNTKFNINLSVPLVLEYEAVAKRLNPTLELSHQDIEAIIDYLCLVGNKHDIFFLWRPFLKDPQDDMVLELAVSARCSAIITFNLKDFANVDMFGLDVLTPQAFLKEIGEL